MFAWITTHPIAYPVLEIVHIVGIALLVGNLVALECRVFGFGRGLDLAALGRLSLTLALSGFGVVAASGLLMFASQPQELLANRAFTLKMGLLMLAGTNAALFHARGGLVRLDRIGRVQTALSLGLWLCVIICGRWIAYL
ncbi:MAG: membrane protein [Methylibium sp. NZG]|nr:MAG: membrane protein [Methylibium sp. NZG]